MSLDVLTGDAVRSAENGYPASMRKSELITILTD